MAASDAKPIPKKGVAHRITFPIYSTTGALITGATALDSEVSKDGGTFADCTGEAGEIATASGVYALDLTATEMTADTVAVIVKTSSANAIIPVIVLYPEETGDIRVSVTEMATDVITSTALAANATTEIQFGLATSSDLVTIANAVGDLATAVGAIPTPPSADDIWEAEIAPADDISAAGVPTARRRLRQLWQDNVKR